MFDRPATRAQGLGIVVSLVQAVSVTWLAAIAEWSWSFSEWAGWPVVSVIVPIAAWVNVAAWICRFRWIVIPAALLTILAPWGFIYHGPLFAIALSIAGVFLQPANRTPLRAAVGSDLDL